MKEWKVPFSYLKRQFADPEPYLDDIRKLVLTGDFTLGEELDKFEKSFAKLCKMPYAIGVGTGTDALILPMKLSGIGSGDEVITTTMTFYATVGAIVATGARPVLVDSTDGFVIDPSKIEGAITEKTRAILTVAYGGNIPDMDMIARIAKKYSLRIFEDTCQSIGGEFDGKPVGSWGDAAGFSLHPLKNLNVWGDGGMVVTKDKEMDEKTRLFRNHGLMDRDRNKCFGINCRLDTLQAVVGNRMIRDVGWITSQRIKNAKILDDAFAKIPEIELPPRSARVKHVYHLYIIRAAKRDELLEYLHSCGIEAKVHYPRPLHLQEAAAYLGYCKGDFPRSERDCESILTLPAHQHLTDNEIEYMINAVKNFYKVL